MISEFRIPGVNSGYASHGIVAAISVNSFKLTALTMTGLKTVHKNIGHLKTGRATLPTPFGKYDRTTVKATKQFPLLR